VRPEPLAPTTPRIIGSSNIVAGSSGFISTEAGIRFSPDPQCCRRMKKSEYRDAENQMRDGCLEAILADPEAIRSRGSTICFGMGMHQDGKSGYEFCQVELAAADGQMRELIVGIKIPGDDVKPVSSLYIHRQDLTDCMHDLHEARLRGNYEGLFVIKKYGTPMRDMKRGMLSGDTTPRSITKNEERKSIWEGQLFDVARACIDNDRFNAGTFEEWLQPFLEEDVDEALRKLDFVTFLYIQERLATSLELNALRDNPARDLEDDDLFQDLPESSEEIRVMKQRVFVSRDGENYVRARCEMLEYESSREKEYGAALADDNKPRFSGGRRQRIKEAGASLSNSCPGLAQKSNRKSEEEELKDMLMAAMSGNHGGVKGSGMGNTELKNGKAPMTAEEEDLRVLLMNALKSDGERKTNTSHDIGNSHDTVMKFGVEEETARPTSTEKSKVTMIVEVQDEKPDVAMTPEPRRPTKQHQNDDENEKIEKFRLLKLKSISPEKSRGGEEMEGVVGEVGGKGEMEDTIAEREEGECDGVCTLI